MQKTKTLLRKKILKAMGVKSDHSKSKSKLGKAILLLSFGGHSP